ncbi:MAG: hypothetical protein CSA96_05285 [Bacteroidetes bacterium]|nr:MAG: hypothetical protein CSA96_05285 [Bacteroidota bacterium]
MKKQLLLTSSILLLAFTFNLTMGQAYHFKEGFGDEPAGWTLTNTYLTSSSANVHNEFDGAKAVKMKGTESVVQTSAYSTAAELSYWILPKAESTTLKVEKSTDDGLSWDELESFAPSSEELDTYQNRTIAIDDASDAIVLRFTATGGADGDALFYLDDVSLTKMDAGPADATLAEISINGVAIASYDAAVMNYSEELFYTEEVEVTAVANASGASVAITQAADIFGDSAARTAVIEVVSEDQSQSLTYTVTVEISDYHFTTGFEDTGDGVMPAGGWEGGYTYTSTNIPGPGDHGDYQGEAALKFVRGQQDKAGYLQSPKYPKLKSVGFWLMIEAPESTAKLKVESVSSAGSAELATITADELSESKWTYFSYDLNAADSTNILFTPTLPADGDTRIWIDDISIMADSSLGTGFSTSGIQNGVLSVFPNPVSDQLRIVCPDKTERISLFSTSGQLVHTIDHPAAVVELSMQNRASGVYILMVEAGKEYYVQKVIRK